MYRYIGTSTFPRRDGSGNLYVVFLAEQQPDGQYRPMTYFNNGRTSVGSFVPVEVYNAVMALKMQIGQEVRVSWGPRGQVEKLEKA